MSYKNRFNNINALLETYYRKIEHNLSIGKVIKKFLNKLFVLISNPKYFDSNNTKENNMHLEEIMNITQGRENNIEIYDLIGTTKNLFNINKSIIEGIYLNGKNKHFYIFFNKKYDIP